MLCYTALRFVIKNSYVVLHCTTDSYAMLHCTTVCIEGNLYCVTLQYIL